MSELSRKLQDLLIREAHLRLTREALAPFFAEKEAELRQVESARPTLLSFSGKEKREAYQARLTDAQQSLQLARNGVQQLDAIEGRITKMLQDEIENMLRAESPEYLQALAANGQRADWNRCIERFTERIYEFTQALGNVRNLACSGYTRDTHIYSQAAVQGFLQAISAAHKVESEIKFANKLSDAQASALKRLGFESRQLPKLREVSYGIWVSRISTLPLVEAQAQFDAIITDAKQVYDSGIPELLSQAAQADTGQTEVINNYLTAAWEQLREDVAPLVKPEDTEASVTDSERMVNYIAQASVMGRMPDAGPGAQPE